MLKSKLILFGDSISGVPYQAVEMVGKGRANQIFSTADNLPSLPGDISDCYCAGEPVKVVNERLSENTLEQTFFKAAEMNTETGVLDFNAIVDFTQVDTTSYADKTNNNIYYKVFPKRMGEPSLRLQIAENPSSYYIYYKTIENLVRGDALTFTLDENGVFAVKKKGENDKLCGYAKSNTDANKVVLVEFVNSRF